MSQNENPGQLITLLSGADPFETYDLPEENRMGVIEVSNTAEWYIVQCDLSAYANQYVNIKFSADVKRVGVAGDLRWQLRNNNKYPPVGNHIRKAAPGVWHKMWGEWTGVLEDSSPVLYLCTWKNFSEITTYYVHNFTAEIILNPEVKKVPVTLRPLSEMAQYLKGLLPDHMPAYPLKPMFLNISGEESLRNGILSFRNFLLKIFDLLIADGSRYDKQAKEQYGTEKHPNLLTGYPFIYYVKSVLINIGYHGVLNKSGDAIMLSDWKLLTDAISNEGYPTTAKISAPKVMECLRFLASGGVCFDGFDPDTAKPNKANETPFVITYPADSAMLNGLKVMAAAQREFHIKGNEDFFLRCDYRILSETEPDVADILKNYSKDLSEKAQAFLLKLHRHYLDSGLICQVKIATLGAMFSYMYKSHILWEYSSTFYSGNRILLKAPNLHKYFNDTEHYPPLLKDKIAMGYGCEKKRFGQPCQKGCHGFSLPLNDTFLAISEDIETWIATEFSLLLTASRKK